jgi:hypothetical protein
MAPMDGADGSKHGHAKHEHSGGEAMHSMMMGPLEIPRTRMGSGTAWLPDSSPMYGLMTPFAGGGVMFHENIFVGYDTFGGDRGSSRFMSVNSLMAMAWQPVGPGELMERAMFSLEPLTVGRAGYPLILQTGETNHGQPLHDRQHPHDFFMELALQYTLPVTDGVALDAYVAPAGEPALGPVAYPHRISAMSDPLAPITHHWQDSTHISYGVLTVGIFTKQLKLEGSWFNGREPDENRWDLDLRTPDSYAARVSWNPDDSWSLQGSYGYLKSPEARDPKVSLQRLTASATYNRASDHESNWASTLVIGQNIESTGPGTPGALLETSCSINAHHAVFGRAEYVRKTGHDLALDPRLDEVAFNVGEASAGYVFSFGPFASFAPGIGVVGSVGVVDGRVKAAYGGQFPVGGMIFGQLRPAAMDM